MGISSFDALNYARKLEAAGFTRQQAEVQAEIFRALAAKVDLKELELRLLKWQFGIGIALAAIMAKGFGWPGF